MSIIEQFQKDYPTKADKVKALTDMTNEQIDELIQASTNVQGKIFYASFKKEERFNPNHDGKTGRFAPKGGGGASGGGSGAGGKTDAELVDESTQVVLSRLTNDVQPFKKETEINMKEVKERGNLTDAEAKQCLAIADKVYDKASQKEPQITADVVSSVSGADGEMYGLAFRLKQPSSMAGKIGEDAKEGGVSFSDAGSDIKDAVRYTAVMDSANFTSGYSNIKSSLESKGYTEVRCKNFYQMYDDGKQCQKAVQCVYADPSGYKFELQFHTPKSQGAKELNHPLYEEYRKKTTSDSRKKELYNQMYEYGQYVDNPKGVMSIKSHN